jgi:hypothetical protein
MECLKKNHSPAKDVNKAQSHWAIDIKTKNDAMADEIARINGL